jgi:hypothetical protein
MPIIKLIKNKLANLEVTERMIDPISSNHVAVKSVGEIIFTKKSL